MNNSVGIVTLSGEKKKDEITVLNHVRLGRYTVVEVQDQTGMKATGLARRSQGDSEKKGVGEQIALARAKKGLVKKRKGEKINHPLIG